MRRGRTWPVAYGMDHNRDLLVGAGLDVTEKIFRGSDDPDFPEGADRAFRARHILAAARGA